MTDDSIEIIENFPIADILLDPGIQIRSELDDEAIEDYAERIRAGQMPPAVRVFHEEGINRLSRGFHRIEAMLRAGLHHIKTERWQGTRRDAILDCMSANADNGVRLTTRDKQRAVTRLLADSEWSLWSDREIARRVNVSAFLVRGMRCSLRESHSETSPQAADDAGTSLRESRSESQLPTGDTGTSLRDSRSEVLPPPSGGSTSSDGAATQKRRTKRTARREPGELAKNTAAPPAGTDASSESQPAEQTPAPARPAVRKYKNRYGKEASMAVSNIGKQGKPGALPKPVASLLKSLPRHHSARRGSDRPSLLVVRLGARARLDYSANPTAHLGRLLQSPDVALVAVAPGSSEDARAVRDTISAELGDATWRTVSVVQVVNAVRHHGLDVLLVGATSEAEGPEEDAAPDGCSGGALSASDATGVDTAPNENADLLDQPQESSPPSCVESLDDVVGRLGRTLTELELQMFAQLDDDLAKFERVKDLMRGRRAFQMPSVDIDLVITAGIKDIKAFKETVA